MEKEHKLQIVVFTVFLLLAQWIALAPMALAQTPFYEGKNVILLSGTDAGGAGDLRTRAVIPVLKKHIPGHPNIVMQYMPGAGGRKAANHMYKSVRPDGLTVGAMITGMVQGTIFGETDGSRTDKFIYLGLCPPCALWFPYPQGRRIQQPGNFDCVPRRAHWRPGRRPQSLHHGPAVRLHAGHERAASRHRLHAAGDRLRFGKERNRCQGKHPGQPADAQCHWLDKELVHVHATIDIPKGFKHADARLAKLPEIESFARSNEERRLIQLFRGARDTGQPFVCRRARRRRKSKYCVKPCAKS